MDLRLGIGRYSSLDLPTSRDEFAGPDLSHLTEEERSIIRGVLQKQQEEERREIKFFYEKHKEVKDLEDEIKHKVEIQKKSGIELESICRLCLKTKFADGIGHLCNYCSVRCCARCGGKMTLRSHKMIWVCILCRKKQELLLKSGRWLETGGGNSISEPANSHSCDPIYRKIELDMALSHALSGGCSGPSRSGSLGGIGHSASISSLLSKALPSNISTTRIGDKPLTSKLRYPSGGHEERNREIRFSFDEPPDSARDTISSLNKITHFPRYTDTKNVLLRQKSLNHDDTLRTHNILDQTEALDCSSLLTPHKSAVADSFNLFNPLSSSYNPSYLYTTKSGYRDNIIDSLSAPEDHGRDECHRHQGSRIRYGSLQEARQKVAHQQASLLDADTKILDSSRRKLDATFRNDSLSSDQSEYQNRQLRPPAPKLHKHRLSRHHHHHNSVSSSDEEIRSTPDCTSCGEEFESESISEKEFASVGGYRGFARGDRCGERKKFHACQVSWTPNPEKTHSIGRMTLKKNKVIDPTGSGPVLLGIKVVGGRILPNNRRGAVIEKVKKGSIADLVGKLRPGDEVLEWNGRSLQSKSYEEVHNIISGSRQDEKVQLVVSRPLIDSSINFQKDLAKQNSSLGAINRTDQYSFARNRPTLTISDPLGDTLVVRPNSPDNTNISRIQVKTFYEHEKSELIVSVISAMNLSNRTNGQYRNPYAKLFLLPDRSELSKRRTKTVHNCNNPVWNQTFSFENIRWSELRSRALEITVWDFDRFGTNDFLGEITIELGSSPLDVEPEWHYLNVSKSRLPDALRQSLLMEQESMKFADHQLVPPQLNSAPGTSRFSDSEYSDFEEGGVGGGLTRKKKQLPLGGSAANWQNANTAILSEPGEHLMMHQDDDVSSVRPRRMLQTKMRPMRRRMLPRTPMELRGGGGAGMIGGGVAGTSGQPPGQEQYARDGRFHSMERGKQRGGGAWTGNVSYRGGVGGGGGGGGVGRGGYSDTEMLSERHYDRDTYMLRHKNRLDRLRQERDQGYPPYQDQPWSDQESMHYPNQHQYPQDHMQQGYPPPMHHNPQHPDYRDQHYQDYDGGGMHYPQNDGYHDYGLYNHQYNQQSQSSVQFRNDPQTDLFDDESRPNQGQLQPGLPKSILRTPTATSISDNEKNDGSLSDTALANIHIVKKPAGSKGMGKKSNSTSQLSDTGQQRRVGLLGAKRTTITVHRSEEVMPENLNPDRRLVRQGTSVSSDGETELFPDNCSESWCQRSEGQLSEFIEGLGPGQLVGRQVLGSPVLGDIQLSMCDKRGDLEVEVIRARGLQSKAGSKVLPVPWAKVYLVSGKKCICKAKTGPARRTLDPLFQQCLTFHERYGGCVLQVTVWGDYGRVEGKKVFMGVAQIMLDDLDLSNIVIGWYKLFGTSSLVSVPPGGGKEKRPPTSVPISR